MIDTDATGRIHYTCMFRYFESAEIEFMRSLGILYSPQSAIGLPRVRVECDFRMAMVYDDFIEIEVWLMKLGRSSLRLEFRALKGGQLAANGAVVLVCMDRQTERSIPIPDDLREKLVPALSGE